MPFYENSIIYKIKRHDDYDDVNIYIGSTTNFKNRKSQHKGFCNNKNGKSYNFPVYKYIRDNGGWKNWIMTPIEEYPCNSKIELEIRERYYIDFLKSTLNVNIPTRTTKEHYQDNKEILLEKSKEWYQNHKNEKKEYDQKYRSLKVICDNCGSEIRKDYLKRHQKNIKCINFVKKD